MKSNTILFTRKSNKRLNYPSNFNKSLYPSDIRSMHLENLKFANIEYEKPLYFVHYMHCTIFKIEIRQFQTEYSSKGCRMFLYSTQSVFSHWLILYKSPLLHE